MVFTSIFRITSTPHSLYTTVDILRGPSVSLYETRRLRGSYAAHACNALRVPLLAISTPCALSTSHVL